jgi:transcriptional regulator
VIDDPTLLKAHLEALTASQEQARDHPWKVDDAPADFIDRRLQVITGFEVAVTRIEGKWKVSQNSTAPDRRGVADGLAREGQTEMAQLIIERSSPD